MSVDLRVVYMCQWPVCEPEVVSVSEMSFVAVPGMLLFFFSLLKISAVMGDGSLSQLCENQRLAAPGGVLRCLRSSER